MSFEITRTELVWPGKYDENGKRKEVERVSLPFQVIERVNESRATRVAKESRNMTLFDYMTPDPAETFEEGWRNKLIWGDNLLVMSSLLDQFAGKVDLIYIDPPFATGADFSVSVLIGDKGEELHKAPSVVEEKAYRDTWGDGLGSYLSMVRDRLVLVRDLLAPNGSLYVHLGVGVSHSVKLLLDDIFGPEHFRSEVVWHYRRWTNTSDTYQQMHDVILYYAKSETPLFNKVDIAPTESQQAVIDKGYNVNKVPAKGGGKVLQLLVYDREKVDSLAAAGRLDLTKYGRVVYREHSLTVANDVWTDIQYLHSQAIERTGYDTQKPEELLSRITSISSSPGDLIADVFAGSGTTLAVAEKLGRRWIGCDLGRFAIHTTRKRLLGIEGCKPFEVLNLGRYERQYWSSATFGTERRGGGVTSIFEYVAFVLKLYRASPAVGLQHLHGRVGAAFVHVGAVDAPVTIDEIAACIAECVALKAAELHILGWEWEMGLHDPMTDEAKARGVKLVLRQIPREVMERQAADKGDVTFFELAYLDVDVQPTKAKHQVVATLRDFVIPNPELVPDEVRDKITKWSDYVDYWAVDWDFADDTFMQGWVTYRTRKDRTVALCSDPHTYHGPGDHAVMVKVIDIFGNDTSRIITVKVS